MTRKKYPDPTPAQLEELCSHWSNVAIHVANELNNMKQAAAVLAAAVIESSHYDIDEVTALLVKQKGLELALQEAIDNANRCEEKLEKLSTN